MIVFSNLSALVQAFADDVAATSMRAATRDSYHPCLQGQGGMVDLFLGQAPAAHYQAVAVQDRAAGAALDAGLISQLVASGTGFVAVDQLLPVL